MAEFIISLFGDQNLGLQVLICIYGYIELLGFGLIFNFKVPFKKKVWLRLAVVFVMTIAFMMISAVIRWWLIDFKVPFNLTYAGIQMAYYLLFIFILYDVKKYDYLLNFSALMTGEILVGKIFSLSLNLFGKNDFETMSFFSDVNDVRDWTIYIIVHLIFTIVLAYLMRNRTNLFLTKKIKRNIVIISITTVIILTFITPISRSYEKESLSLAIMTKIFLIIICMLILFFQTTIFAESKREKDVYIIQELMHKEKMQLTTLQGNIDVINAKCHDLKHMLNSLETKITKEELAKLKEASDIYDSTIKTSNDTLDAILYQHQLMCQNNKIRFSVMADGECLKFVEPTKLYSLMSNALNNAYEASVKVEEEKRIIDVNIHKNNNFAVIEVLNYVSGGVKFKNGTPVSSKNDGSNHGYGYKSMKYIIDEYNGNLTTSLNNQVFTLTIFLPLPDNKSE